MSGWIPVETRLPAWLADIDVWGVPLPAYAAAGAVAKRFPSACLSANGWMNGQATGPSGNLVPIMGFTITHWRPVPRGPRSRG